MLKNLIKLNAVRPLSPQNKQVLNINYRMKTTKEFPVATRKLAATCPNPLAREISKNNDNQQHDVGSLNKQKDKLAEDEKERRLKVLKLEVDIANQEGRRVPTIEFFKDHHWEHVLTLPSKSARMKYYGFLWQIEMKKEAKQRKKEERAAASQERLKNVRQERAENPHIIYGLGHVSMFLRIYDSTINHWMNHR